MSGLSDQSIVSMNVLGIMLLNKLLFVYKTSCVIPMTIISALNGW